MAKIITVKISKRRLSSHLRKESGLAPASKEGLVVRFFGVIGLVVPFVLSGCATTKLIPDTKAPAIYRTPIEGATAQVILPEAFQRKIITQKPSFGRAWSVFDFETPIGEPMSKALVSEVASRVPATRVGDRDDGKSASIKVTANDVVIEFGIDDGSAIKWTTALGPIGLASDVTVGATVNLTTTISINGAAPRAVTTTGVGQLPMAYGSLSKSDFGAAIGLAINDAALKLGEEIQSESAR